MVSNKGNTPKESLVAGLFHNDADAHGAIRDLKTAGFEADKIQEFGHRPDAVVGREEGGFMSSLSNFFGSEPEPMTTPGTEATITTTELTRMGLSEEDAGSLQRGLAEGDVLLIVHTGTRGMDALDILKRHNASPGLVEFDGTSTGTAPSAATGTQRIQLLKEVMRVNKERVQRGEVRLRKEVVSETQTVEVPTTREELIIERHPVAEGQAASGQIGDGGEIRVTLSEDKVTAEKRSVVAEEVTVGKREVQETKEVSDTVRREELRTEREGDVVIDGDIKDKDVKKPLI